MKKLTVAVLTIAALGAFNVNAAQFSGSDNSVETQICLAVASDSKGKLHRAVRQSQQSMSYIAQSVKCNGMSLSQFAAEHGASDISKQLVRVNRPINVKTVTAKL